MAKVHVFKVIKYGHRHIYRRCPSFPKVLKWPTTLDTSSKTEDVKGKAGPGNFANEPGLIGWRAVWEREGNNPTWRWTECDPEVSKTGKLKKLKIKAVLEFAEPAETEKPGMK